VEEAREPIVEGTAAQLLQDPFVLALHERAHNVLG
jgi:hypothetical protein